MLLSNLQCYEGKLRMIINVGNYLILMQKSTSYSKERHSANCQHGNRNQQHLGKVFMKPHELLTAYD